MEKEALLKIIIQDIKELEMLIETFSGNKEIPAAFLKLAKSKAQGILDEIDLLDSFNSSEVTDTKEQLSTSSVDKDEAGIKEEAPIKATSLHKEQTAAYEKQTYERKLDEKKKTHKEFTEKQEVKSVDKTEEIKSNIPKENIPTSSKVLGESFSKEKQSYNELLAREHTENNLVSNQPIKDLKKAIGINDRFFYQRELFDGNSELFTQTLEQLNDMSSFEAAESFLQSNFSWDKNNQAAIDFTQLVKRRFM